VAAVQSNVRVARSLMKAEGAAAALSKHNNKGLLPLDLAKSDFCKAAFTLGMRANNIAVGGKK
jgi:hypothetical protein